MIPKDSFIRNLEADAYRENFLVSAVVSIFVIRIYLKLTNYPHLGGAEFHIAHMLWGGFFMLAAIIIMMSFLSRGAVTIAAVLGGIGFGTFIDELGKFITSDNNYFFRPTIALIYIIFVLVYLILKFIPRYHKISRKEYLVNAIDMIKEAAINDFDVEEEKRAKTYLRHCDPDDPTVVALKKLLKHIDASPMPPPGLFTRARILLRNTYYVVARSGIILKIVIFFLSAQMALTVLQTITVFRLHQIVTFSEGGKLYSTGLASLFVLIGLFALRFSKEEAYRYFRIALLITILLTEFFAFMRGQWFEVINLAANVFMLFVINYAMEKEKEKEAST